MAILNKKKHLPYFILFIYACLIVAGMLRHPLWFDEAETGIFARNILKTGLPYGWDGTNLMGLQDGYRLNSHLLNNVEPWLQYYVTAASFAFFGFTTFSARLPFIVISILSFLVFYKLTCRLFPKTPIPLLSLFILGINVPHILFSYQSRYYPLVTLFSLILAYMFIDLESITFRKFIFVILVSILLFHSNFLSFVAFYAAIILARTILKCSITASAKKIFVLTVLLLIATISWYIIMNPSSTVKSSLLPNLNITNGLILTTRVLNDFAYMGLFSVFLVFMFIYVLKKQNRKYNSSLLYVTLIVLFYVIFFSFLSNQPLHSTTRSDIRFYMNMVPFLIMISAYCIFVIFKYNKITALILFTLVSFTNILGEPTAPRIWLLEYVKEMASKQYISPIQASIDYLSIHSSEGDTVYIRPDYYAEPLIFYLGQKIKVINRISPNNFRLLEQNKNILPEYITSDPNPPKWVILFSGYALNDKRPWLATISKNQYQEIRLPVISYDATRPEIFSHEFLDKDSFDPNSQLIILKRTQ